MQNEEETNVNDIQIARGTIVLITRLLEAMIRVSGLLLTEGSEKF